MKHKLFALGWMALGTMLVFAGCVNYGNQQPPYYQNMQQPYGYYNPQQFPMGNTTQPNQQATPKQQTAPAPNTQKSTGGTSGGTGGQQYYGGGTQSYQQSNNNNWWGDWWGGGQGVDQNQYYQDYGYGTYDQGTSGYGGAYDYYGGGYDQSTQDYMNQTYQDIYENRAATNQEINDNTSQWLYEGTANYINPETGELEAHDYTQGNDWYQDTTTGEQYQSSDSSYTPEYSYETQMEQYGGWASDYSASDYGYDSGGDY